MLGGLEGVGRLVRGDQRECEKIVTVSPAGLVPDGELKVGDCRGRMTQHQVRSTAQQLHFRVLGSEVDGLVEPRECLVGLVPRELDGANPLADLGMQGIELECPEIGSECIIGPPHRLELAGTGEMGLGIVRLDLDSRLESLECGLGIALGILDGTQPDQGADKVRIKLERPPEARFGLVQPALKHQDFAQPLMNLGGPGNLGGKLEQLSLRLFQIAPIDGRLGSLADLLGASGLLGGGCVVMSSPPRTRPTASGTGRKQA